MLKLGLAALVLVRCEECARSQCDGVCCRYVSNTRIKFLLVLNEPVPKDEEMRMVSTHAKAELDFGCGAFLGSYT